MRFSSVEETRGREQEVILERSPKLLRKGSCSIEDTTEFSRPTQGGGKAGERAVSPRGHKLPLPTGTDLAKGQPAATPHHLLRHPGEQKGHLVEFQACPPVFSLARRDSR